MDGAKLMRTPLLFFKKVKLNISRDSDPGAARQTNVI